MSRKPTILFDNEFCHVVDKRTGNLELVEGPQRFVLPPHKSLYKNKSKKIIIRENEYIFIENPYCPNRKTNIMGGTIVLKGPLTRSLFPLEKTPGVKKAYILGENEVAVVQALNNHEDRKAGEKWQVKGPCSYIPSKDVKVLRTVKATQISQNEAIYVQNILTGKLSMVEGPMSYIPTVDEKLYQKELSPEEISTLKITNSPSHYAYTIQVQKSEAVCIVDTLTDEEKYILGPSGYQLGPLESVKIIDRAGGLPKVENTRKLGVVRLGPDFINDLIIVRTKDNAILEILITYKWKFILDDRYLYKIFHGDFVGYSCQSMRSRVREAVSKHDFEHFHTNSSEILRDGVFKKLKISVQRNEKTEVMNLSGRFFPEFNFLIFSLDVKKIRPVDAEIEQLLDEAIKSSMTILVRKQREAAETEQQKNEIANRVEIEKMRSELIILENKNLKAKLIERAKIEGMARVEKSKSEMTAEDLLSKSKLELELQALKEKMKMLKGKEGDSFLEYTRTKLIEGTIKKNMIVVPEGTERLLVRKRKRGVAIEEEDPMDMIFNLHDMDFSAKKKKGRNVIRM